MPEGSTKKERRGNSGICAPLFIANGKVLFLRGLIPVEISRQEMKTGSILIFYMSKVPA